MDPFLAWQQEEKKKSSRTRIVTIGLRSVRRRRHLSGPIAHVHYGNVSLF